MEVRVKQPPTATARPNGRKGSRKVRTGCLTCKVRKVKCDETKPQCLRCTRTGHHCRGYASAPLPDSAAAYFPDTSHGTHHHHHHYHRSKTPPQQSSALSSSSGPHPTPSPSPGSWPHATLARSEDPHAFDFFRKYSAALFSFSSDASFWSDLVLRVSAHDPAIHNAASAIGNFHIDFLSASNPGHPGAAEPFSTRLSPIRLRAITQYNKAINNVVPVLSGTKACEPVVLTMISILFACIEYLQGNERQGLKHIIQARRLLAHFGRTNQLSSSDISLLKRHAVPLITRSSWRAQFFGLKASPIPDELQDYLVIPSSFASVQDARDCFFAIFDQTLYSIRPKEAPFFESELGRLEGPEADKRAYAGRRISDWWSAFVLSKAIGPAEFRESAQAVSVQLWYKTSQLIHELWGASRESSDEAAASGRPSYSESLFDCRGEDFFEVYSLSSQFFALRSRASPGAPSSPPDIALPGVPTRPMSGNKVFEFESHILSNVLWGAGKCRHPRLRRQFALLLAQNDHVYENAIYAKEAAIVAARIIKLEEDAAREYARRYGTFTEDSTHWGLGENPDPAGTQPDPEARQLQLDRDFAAVCSLGYWPLPLNGTRDMAPEPEPDSPPALPRTELSPTLAYRPISWLFEQPRGDLQTPENSPPSEASARGSENGSNSDEPSVYATLRNIPDFPLKPPFGIPYSARICETHLISRHPNGIWIQHTKRPWGSDGKAEYIQEWVEL